MYRFGHLIAFLVSALRCVVADTEQQVLQVESSARVFTLRHIHHHGAHKFPQLHRSVDVLPEELRITDENGRTLDSGESRFTVHEDSMSVLRSSSKDTARWESSDVKAPNVTDKQTVLSFAKMAANAYARKDNSSEWKWQDVGSGFNYTDDFGWENDGLRGHVFADEKNQTVVISIKGTSVLYLADPDTTTRDLETDNLFASCCCAQGGSWWWKTVCDCRTSSYTCNSTCLVEAFRTNNSYYWAAEELYYNVTLLYPGADIWMTGHSLGGVVSALLGLTFGLPTLTYEAYPDALAASRLGLSTPPGYKIGGPETKALHGSHIHHFGHTADPIFMGTCNGYSYACTYGGFALEGKCHTGKRCVYDTVKDLKWREDSRKHSIVTVIQDVLEVYDQVPSCERDIDCIDCAKWTFLED